MSRFLVKYRKGIFALMVVLVAACALLVPRININTDMTKYMPDSYVMKQGLDIMEQELPALQDRMQEFGSLCADGNDLMPTDLPRILAIGVAMLFVVLLVMCSSVMEVLLFLITTGFAVVLNMGTNAFLPSVSMMTNMLAPVLQMVLSMDYCIILMNRYRQEKTLGKDKETAMEGAIRGGASSILSSAFNLNTSTFAVVPNTVLVNLDGTHLLPIYIAVLVLFGNKHIELVTTLDAFFLTNVSTQFAVNYMQRTHGAELLIVALECSKSSISSTQGTTGSQFIHLVGIHSHTGTGSL